VLTVSRANDGVHGRSYLDLGKTESNTLRMADDKLRLGYNGYAK